MKIGFDGSWTHAVVAYGYPLDHLTAAQCLQIAGAMATASSDVTAAPNGDLSPTGIEALGGPDEPTSFTFVVGALVSEVRVKATQSAGEKKVTFDDDAMVAAERRFEEARAFIDRVLAGLGLAGGPPGLFVLAAGPMACASVEAVGDAMIVRSYSDGETEPVGTTLDVTYDANPDAERVLLKGKYTLAARYA